jgi:hypothetical protein
MGGENGAPYRIKKRASISLNSFAKSRMSLSAASIGSALQPYRDSVGTILKMQSYCFYPLACSLLHHVMKLPLLPAASLALALMTWAAAAGAVVGATLYALPEPAVAFPMTVAPP